MFLFRGKDQHETSLMANYFSGRLFCTLYKVCLVSTIFRVGSQNYTVTNEMRTALEAAWRRSRTRLWWNSVELGTCSQSRGGVRKMSRIIWMALISDVVRKYGRLFDNRCYVLIDDVIENRPTIALQWCTSLICLTWGNIFPSLMKNYLNEKISSETTKMLCFATSLKLWKMQTTMLKAPKAKNR